MLANDIKKGTAIRYTDGSCGEMLDNRRGIIRRMSVEFGGREDSGDQYIKDLSSAWNADTGQFEAVEFSPAQIKRLKRISSFGF